ncbi:MAG: hypothetical protein IIC02_03370, partial [Planctomycetes bacterium]|nr:hypothetical protein [Planctomycetota bacterium]
NYRAAATCLFKVLTDPGNGGPLQVDQGDADALSVKTEAGKYVPNGEDSGYKLPVVWSKMLTVWRKLHVEVDSMMAPDFTNTQTDIIPSAPTFNATNNHAFITLAGLESVFNKTDQHKVGRIDVLERKRGHSTFSSSIAGFLSSHPSRKVECPLFFSVLPGDPLRRNDGCGWCFERCVSFSSPPSGMTFSGAHAEYAPDACTVLVH